MSKLLTIIGGIAFVLIALLLIIPGGNQSSRGEVLTQGSYIYGEDVYIGSYMFNLSGPGEIIIDDENGEEVYYKQLKESEGIHEHSLPLYEGYSIEITDGASLGFV